MCVTHKTEGVRMMFEMCTGIMPCRMCQWLERRGLKSCSVLAYVLVYTIYLPKPLISELMGGREYHTLRTSP